MDTVLVIASLPLLALSVLCGWMAAVYLIRRFQSKRFDQRDSVDEAGDQASEAFGFQRTTWWTGNGDRRIPVVAGPEPADIAVDDAQVSQLIWECLNAQHRIERGDDIYAGARREPSPEVKR